MGPKICTAIILGLVCIVVAQWRHEQGLPTLTSTITGQLVANGTINADPTPAPSAVAPEAKPAAIAAKPKASAPRKARKPASKSKGGYAYTDNAASWGGK